MDTGRQLPNAARNRTQRRERLQDVPRVRETFSAALNAVIEPAAARQRAATNRLFAIYLLVSAGALLFPQHRPGWPILLVLHVTFAALLWGTPASARIGRALTSRFPRAFEVLADWYPLLLVPVA